MAVYMQVKKFMHISSRALEQPSHYPVPLDTPADIRPHPVQAEFKKFASDTSLLKAECLRQLTASKGMKTHDRLETQKYTVNGSSRYHELSIIYHLIWLML